MPAISGGDKTIMRGSPRHDLVFNIVPLVEAATALVNGTPNYADPVAEITVDNTSANWLTTGGERDQYFRITKSTGELALSGSLRRPNTAATMYVAALREGDNGDAQEIAQSIADNDTITIYTARIPASYYSYFLLSGVIYKRYDVEFDATYPQTQYPDPHVNMGEHQWAKADPITGVARFSLDASSSILWTGSLDGYSWTLPTGVTLVAGYSDTDAAIEVDAEPGVHEIRCRVARSPDTEATDANAGYRYLFVTDDANPSFGEQYGVEIESDEEDVNGRTMILRVTCNLADAETLRDTYFYLGALTLVQDNLTYSADGWTTVDAAPSGAVKKFVGFVYSYKQVTSEANGKVQFLIEVRGPAKWLDALSLASQELTVASTLENWTHVHSSLANVAFFAYYVLWFHAPGLMRLMDFDYGDVNSFQRPGFKIGSGGNMASGMKAVMEFVSGGTYGCTSEGKLCLRRNPSYETDAWRSSNTNCFTWDEDDIVGKIEYSREPFPKYGRTMGEGFVSNTDFSTLVGLVGCAGLYAAGIGSQEGKLPGFIGASTNDILDRIGHHHQALNSPTQSFSLEARPGYTFMRPALAEWHTMNVAAYDPLDCGVFEGRALVTNVVRDWGFENGNVTCRTTVTMVPETKGKRAIVYPNPEFGTVVASCTQYPTTSYDWEGSSAGDPLADYFSYTGGIEDLPEYASITNPYSLSGLTSIPTYNWYSYWSGSAYSAVAQETGGWNTNSIRYKFNGAFDVFRIKVKWDAGGTGEGHSYAGHIVGKLPSGELRYLYYFTGGGLGTGQDVTANFTFTESVCLTRVWFYLRVKEYNGTYHVDPPAPMLREWHVNNSL